ncbi:LPXTG cell wall anchor domain-containing protein [Lactobacillus helveticus]|nr:LPXTG cell wall anchor domain-containing protein [Lactobacillus helveticus]
MNTSFTLTGQINLGSRTSSQGGADGISFAFHTGNTTDIGNAGGNLGIGGLQNAIGFKLDTYHNGYKTPQANKDGAQVASNDSNGYGYDTDPDGTQYPQFGAFVTTSPKLVQAQDGNSYSRWWATTDMSSVKKLNSRDLDGQFHDFVVSYDGSSSRTLTIKYTETGGNVLTWSTSIPDTDKAMAMVVSASTGGNKNLQQFEISSFDFKQAATVDVKYVDQKGNPLAQGTASYPNGTYVNGTYTTGQLEIPNYKFVRMDDGTATGAKSLPAKGTLTKAGDNGMVIYVYAPYTQTSKTISETIKYIDQEGKEVGYTADPITFVTVTDPVTKITTTYYKNGTQKQPTLNGSGQPEDGYGQPDNTWTESNEANFPAVTNPTVPGYHVIKTTDPTNDLTQTTSKTVDITNGNLNYTVTYTPNAEKANVTYIDDTTGKTLSAKDLTGDYGSTDPYRTGDTIADYEKQGYQLVSDNYPTNGVVYNQDGTVQSFEVHLTHETTPVGPNNPQTPGEPINPNNPDGPKWPTGTDQSSLTQTITRTVNYYDKQTVVVVGKKVTEQVTYNRTAIIDKVTGQIIGYSMTGGNTVDQTDGSKAWIAKDGDTNWAAVTSPDLSSEGYTAPDLATVEQTAVNPGDKDATVNVYYDHVVVPVNPSKPETPETPINPDNSDGPKWPTGTDKDSLTKSVNQTIHYQYSNGATAAPDKTDTTTFDHQIEVDKVTGKIVKDDGWSAENDKTSFDAKTSPVIAGYTASEASSKTVTGLTQNSPDDVQTVIYSPNAEKANVTYIDDKTGKTLSTKDLTGNYGSTDPYRTSETIADYEKQGYQLVSDNYPTNGVVYNQDGTVQSFEVHLTHGTTQTSENQTVNETIHYVYKNGGKAADDYQATPLNFTRTVTTDKVTGDKSYGDWVAANGTSFAAVTSPAIKGYAPDQAEIGSQTVSGDSSDLDFTVVYAKNAPIITTESKTINETIHYVYKDGTTAHDDYVAKPVEFTREVSTDAVTGEKTYGPWSAPQSFDAVTSPELKGYTADKAQIDKQTVNGDSKDLEFTVTYTKTPVAGGNVTAKYVDENGNPIADDVIASGNVGDPYSTTQKDVPGYTFKEVQGNPTGSFTDQDQTVTYVYTKNPATDNNGGTGLNQPGKPGNGTDTGNPSSNQPGNPSQPSNATNNGVINTSTNTGSKVNNGAVNSPELPQTGENNSQSQTMSFIGILLALFGSLLGFLGIKKRRNY